MKRRIAASDCPSSKLAASLGMYPSIVDYTLLLPLDVLSFLLAFIPVHPRLRVVSLVCKRWRSAVLRLITRLPSISVHRESLRALHLFPNLTEMQVPLGVADFDFTIPPKLAVLRLHPGACEKRSCNTRRFLENATNLTAVDLHTTYCCWARKMLLKYRTQIKQLRLTNNDPDEPGPQLALPFDKHFPLLAGLDLATMMVPDQLAHPLTQFVMHHAPQLTGLRCYYALPAWIEFPRIPARSIETEPGYEGLLSEILELIASDRTPAASIVELEIHDVTLETQLQAALEPFSNLRTLELQIVTVENVADVLAQIPQISSAGKLKELTIVNIRQICSWVPVSLDPLPSLIALHVNCRVNFLPNCFPKVERVEAYHPTPYKSALAYYETCLLGCPIATVMSLKLWGISDFTREMHLEPLLSFLRKCEARGLEHVILGDEVADVREDLKLIKWMRVSIRARTPFEAAEESLGEEDEADAAAE